MKRSDLESLEALLMKEVVKRRQLGGYSMEAEGILLLSEATLRILQHMIETYPEPKNGSRKSRPEDHQQD